MRMPGTEQEQLRREYEQDQRKWATYERLKRQLPDDLSPEEYEAAVQKIKSDLNMTR